MGRVGRNQHVTADNYGYKILFSLECFIYVYERIHDPDKDVIDKSYVQDQVDDLMEVVAFLESTKKSMLLQADGTSA
eukprot:14282332-Ditylum_brightwellii.AAC.1